jgi:hypothetical protein
MIADVSFLGEHRGDAAGMNVLESLLLWTIVWKAFTAFLTRTVLSAAVSFRKPVL